MKKWLLIGAILIVVIFGTILFIDFQNYSRQMDEFYSFREYLDTEFFPLLELSSDHFDQAATAIDNNNFTNYYALEGGMEVNLDIRSTIEETSENIINKDLKYEDSLNLKKISLNMLTTLEETCELLYWAPTEFEYTEFELFETEFTAKIEELTSQLEELNKVLSEYYE